MKDPRDSIDTTIHEGDSGKRINNMGKTVADRKTEIAESIRKARERGEEIKASTSKTEFGRGRGVVSGDPDDIDIEPNEMKRGMGMKMEDFEEPRSSNGNVTVNVNLGNGKTQVDAPEHRLPTEKDYEDIPERTVPTPATKKGLKKEIEGEKARRAAIIKAQKRTAPLENKLERERERTEGIKTGEYTPTFCDKHPKVCKTAKNIKTAAIVATAPLWLPDVAVEKVAKVTAKGARKVAGAVSKAKSKRNTPNGQTKTTTKPKTPQNPRKPSSKPKTATGTGKPRKSSSKPVSKPKKAKSTAKTTRSTPKKRSTKKTAKKSNGGWWGNGDAGL